MSRRSCGHSKGMRLSQVCNILCTICYACLFIHGCTTWFDSECCMSSPKNSVWVVGLLWHFLPLRESPCTDLLISSLTTLALGMLIIYIVLFFRKKINFFSLFGLYCELKSVVFSTCHTARQFKYFLGNKTITPASFKHVQYS